MNRDNIIENYYRHNYPSLIKLARRRIGNYSLPLAEEAVQEAFVRALKYFHTYKRQDQFDKWFKRILNNCINYIKAQERGRGVTFNLNIDIEELDRGMSFELPIDILEQMRDLSERDKQIIELYFFAGFKSREISEFVNVKHDNVRRIILLFRRSISGTD